jgi:hypothetical protein
LTLAIDLNIIRPSFVNPVANSEVDEDYGRGPTHTLYHQSYRFWNR